MLTTDHRHYNFKALQWDVGFPYHSAALLLCTIPV